MPKKRYTVTEIEILSILESLKYLRTILHVQKLWINTDHKNLMCKTFNDERVLRWWLILEEYVPGIDDIKGENNIVIAGLSIIPLNVNKETT